MNVTELLRPDSGREFAFVTGALGALAGVVLSMGTSAGEPLLWASAGAVVGILVGLLVETMR